MSIILRNTKNVFTKEQKIVTDEFLENHDKMKWKDLNPESRLSKTEDEYRKNYKAVYK